MSKVNQINNLLELCTSRGNRIDQLDARIQELEADAARWRAIAPHLQVAWDEGDSGKRSTWIEFAKGWGVEVPNAGNASWADGADFDSPAHAIDALINSRSSKNG